jgi:formamidopyrimidine-DNA glycosylase
MPELPDLQVFSRNLTKALKGKKLEKIDIKVIQKLNVTEKALKDTLESHKISGVIRVGKELHFEFENKHVLGLHLMLHGQLFFYNKTNENKFTILEMLFDDGTGLALTDFQKAATPTLDPADNSTPDALNFEDTYLEAKLAGTKTPVKTVLMDQHILRGIGNAYADEILYDAKLSPFSASNQID